MFDYWCVGFGRYVWRAWCVLFDGAFVDLFGYCFVFLCVVCVVSFLFPTVLCTCCAGSSFAGGSFFRYYYQDDAVTYSICFHNALPNYYVGV